MTYLIDTDVMVDFFKFKEPAKLLLQNLSKKSRLALCAVSVTEIRTGWTDEQASRLLPKLYKMCLIEVVSQEIAEQAGIWRSRYMAQGKPLATPDTIIAATAFLNGHCLVTNNRKDYPMPELNIYQNQ